MWDNKQKRKINRLENELRELEREQKGPGLECNRGPEMEYNRVLKAWMDAPGSKGLWYYALYA